MQYSPDTTDTYAGYDHDNERSTGFSMTHASVGCAAFGDISMLPTTAPIGPRPWDDWEEIAHDGTEVGVPGYYTVRFPATGVTAELTATTRTGVGRFSYPANGQPALFHVRSGASLGGNDAATIQIGQDHSTITGSATTGGFCGKNNTYTVYFAMKFSRPFTSYGTWDGDAVYPGAGDADSIDSGGYVEFPAGSVLEARTAISYVSVDGARANLAAEGGRSFDEVRAAALAQWNAALAASPWPAPIAVTCKPSIPRYTEPCCTPTRSTTPTDVISDSTATSTPWPRGTPSTPTSPTGTPIGAWRPCRHCSSRRRPATWPNRWSTTPSRADRFPVGPLPIPRPAR
ncbi:glycosyl hydrolase 92 family protein [Mycobacterium kansasii 824]|nr:glycosyl hydrolase 92 family protein [Mycobacterium kansasii 824]